MNRLGISNLNTRLGPQVDIQMLGDYIMYRNPDGTKIDNTIYYLDSVHGVWIYEEKDRERIFKIMDG